MDNICTHSISQSHGTHPYYAYYDYMLIRNYTAVTKYEVYAFYFFPFRCPVNLVYFSKYTGVI